MSDMSPKKLLKLFSGDVPRTCENCIKKHTVKCPNSFLCYSKDNKPYWEWTYSKKTEVIKLVRLLKQSVKQ